MSETASGAFAGAAQGAAAGAAIGGVPGAIIGGIVGAVGGIFGSKKKKKARKFAAKAAEVRRKQQGLKLAVQRRDIVRSLRIQRAAALAAGSSDEGVTSSAVAGSVSSLGAQGNSALNYFDSQVGLDNQYQMYAKKAGKAAGEAAEIFTFLGAAGDLAKIGGDLYGLSKTATPAATAGGGYASFNSSAAVSNMENNSAFNTFGASLNLGE